MDNIVTISNQKSQNFKGFSENRDFYYSYFGTVHIPNKTWLSKKTLDKPDSLKKIRGYDKISPSNVKITHNQGAQIGTTDNNGSWIIPTGWMMHENIKTHFGENGFFLSLCLVKKHNIPFIEYSGDQQISRRRICQILNYICSFLQVGENIKLMKRYNDFTRGFPLKYLPFTIDPEYFHYWIYMPTKENIQKAIISFQNVLTTIEEIDFLRLFAVAEMTQKLFAAKNLYDLTNISRDIFQKELTENFGCLERKLSYVYQGLAGPQDCLHFDCLIIG